MFGIVLQIKHLVVRFNVATVFSQSHYASATNILSDMYLPLEFNTVEQDARGTGMSQGYFSYWNTSSEDIADTIRWIVAQVSDKIAMVKWKGVRCGY